MAMLSTGLPGVLHDLNAGIVALALNVVTLAVVSAAGWRVPSADSVTR